MPTACAAMSMRPPSTIVARDGKPLIQAAEQIGFRHAAILQPHIDRLAGPQAQHLVGLTDDVTGRAGFDDEGGQAVATLGGIRQRIDDGDACLAAASDESLVAIEDEMIAIGSRRRTNRASVRAG